jgi:hypothetical protein
MLPRPANDARVEVRLVPSAALSVHVVDRQGEPVAGTNIRMTGANGTSVGPSNDLGYRRNGHLQPGRCGVAVGNIGAWLRIAGEPTIDQLAKAFEQLRAQAPGANEASKIGEMTIDLRAGEEAALMVLDVLGHSAREAADLLGTTEGSARILHLRARRALADYDASRCVPTAELRERHRAALQQFLDCLTNQDVRGIEAILAESVRTVTDAAGEYTALATPLEGRARVARFYQMAALHRQAGGTHTEMRLVNGLPAAIITVLAPVRRQAPRSLLRCELDDAGHIVLVHAVLAPRKLASLIAP